MSSAMVRVGSMPPVPLCCRASPARSCRGARCGRVAFSGCGWCAPAAPLPPVLPRDTGPSAPCSGELSPKQSREC